MRSNCGILFFVLTFCYKSQSICLVPSKDILDACKVGQLSIVIQTNLIIRNQALCNREISQDFLNQMWNIKIENYFSFDFTKNTTFTLVMIDVTHNKLLWMLSNISSTNGDIATSSGSSSISNYHVVTVKSYTPPSFFRESLQASHLIQIFIFQEDTQLNSPPRTTSNPFYIRDWLMQSQSPSSKHLMCGPVAGLQFKINQSPLSKDYKSMGTYVYDTPSSSPRGNFQVELFIILYIILSCY
uniref:Uncharacterized protein n=1 Tax=Cacopsylla melanoneura TaxID=428564 RepID=A0A8D8SLH8_9HEMI